MASFIHVSVRTILTIGTLLVSQWYFYDDARAEAFLTMLSKPLPATTELVVTVTTMLGALALTAAGAEVKPVIN